MIQNVIDKNIEVLRKGELLRENEVKILCAFAREIFIEESNVQRIDTPVTICGDLHGQFYDLLELFKTGGECPSVNYLFLGDYVNRGHHSIETILLLFSLKVKYPDRITLLRGNHESRIITQVFGFYDECLRKYGSLNVWRYIIETFEYLTISAIIEDKIFCTHGGIASDANTLDDIRCLDRVMEIPSSGEMCELLWNDPEEEINGFGENARGSSYIDQLIIIDLVLQIRTGKTFGKDVFQKFIHQNAITKIFRAHQLVMDGFKQIWNDSCSTVWSAPNYCYRCGNMATIVEIKSVNSTPLFKKFEAAQVYYIQFIYQQFMLKQEQIKGASQRVASNVPDYFL